MNRRLEIEKLNSYKKYLLSIKEEVKEKPKVLTLKRKYYGKELNY
ncbi:MAG: hypothetical protein RSB77_02080 [Bacilli bacterium]